MMKNVLSIPYTSALSKNSSLQSVSSFMDALPMHGISNEPWPGVEKNVRVLFSIAHTIDSILLKYFVEEPAIRAVNTAINQPVYQDSCVEFFIAFQQEEPYYNLEFNCLGACLASFGRNRNDRVLLPVSILEQIQSLPSVKKQARGEGYQWELCLVIPFSTFLYHRINTLNNKTCRVNFYKCGDFLPVPHYLCWNPIRSFVPDFHLPQFFGEACFAG
jgi:hypothetical protein